MKHTNLLQSIGNNLSNMRKSERKVGEYVLSHPNEVIHMRIVDLAQEAHVLLLDEPFAGLDQPAQELLAQLLRDLASDGRLIVASHHDLKTVGDIFGEVVLLNGTLIAQGPSTEAMTQENLKRAFGNRE